jgi:hypothetical protein
MIPVDLFVSLALVCGSALCCCSLILLSLVIRMDVLALQL